MISSKPHLTINNSASVHRITSTTSWHCIFTYTILLLLMPFCVNAQIISTFAGTGIAGFSGDGGPATAAKVGTTVLGYFDTLGNYYFGTNATRIRMVDYAGNIHTLAGTGSGGFSGDNGPATAANINYYGMAVDKAGNMFIGDYVNYRVRKVNKATGIITTIAGNGTLGFYGDNGPATAATAMPTAVCADDFGNIYFADSGGVRVRKIAPSGIITTIAGNGVFGDTGDGGPATAASISVNTGICSDTSGNLYLACDSTVRKIDISTGIISKIAGAYGDSYAGDGMPATAAHFNAYTIGINKQNNEVYIADYGNRRVYKIDTANIFRLVAGTGVAGFNSDGIPATASELYDPEGVTTDACGNVYIADEANYRIRKITYPPILTTPTITLSGVNLVYVGALVTVTATVTNAGSSYNIEWYNHGIQFTTTTVPYVTYTKGAGTDTITAKVVSTATYGCYDSTTSAGHIITADPTGITRFSSTTIAIYPNPANEVIHIDGIITRAHYFISTIVGTVLRQGSLTKGNNTIPINSLPPGMYLLEINSDRERTITRIIKQ